MLREESKWKPHKDQSTDAEHRGGATRSSVEGPVIGLEQRGCVVQLLTKEQPKKGKILLEKVKSFNISKRQVWEAYKCVKANRGGAGIDNQSIGNFEEDISNNLFKIWNRMSSGSYFPPPVKRVEIPKGDGRMRPLGIPTAKGKCTLQQQPIRIGKNHPSFSSSPRSTISYS